ncbi:hypothetical protein VTN31DRAFT_5005 [Thermomyces dupontii]|uniref:uncharacterized protein n=1 Tax=Talaromyces thermophilus TaxID=28565 RepID=UPI003743C195
MESRLWMKEMTRRFQSISRFRKGGAFGPLIGFDVREQRDDVIILCQSSMTKLEVAAAFQSALGMYCTYFMHVA